MTPPDAAARGRAQIGWDAGQPVLGEPGSARAKRELSSHADVLPELIEAEAKPRPIWKAPAFIVSIILTFVALVVAAVLLILSLFAGGPARVSSLELEGGDGANAHLTWSSGGAPVDLYVVDGDQVTDLSPLIREDEAWVPSALGAFDGDSCFVVRPTSQRSTEVSLAADELEAQGARSACVADAS